MSLFIALFVLSVWTVYRLKFPENLLLDELIWKPMIWLTPVLIFVKFNFQNLGFTKKNIIKNILLGLSLGLLLSLERILIKHSSLEFSFIFIISAFFTAVTEEIFFRGFLLSRWLKFFKNPLGAMILNGLFFTLTHVPIAVFVFHYSGYGLFSYLLVNFISGFADIFLFYQTKSIYASIANHTVWNMFSGLFK